MYLNVKVKEADGMEVDRTDKFGGKYRPSKEVANVMKTYQAKIFIRHFLFPQICTLQKGGV
jgi:hypothetical protein